MQRLAGVLAYLEVSEAGPNAHLEKEAQDKFEHWMTWVDSEVQEFKPTQHKVKGGGLPKQGLTLTLGRYCTKS